MRLDQATQLTLVGTGQRRLVDAPVLRQVVFLEDRVRTRQALHVGLRGRLGRDRLVVGRLGLGGANLGPQVAVAGEP